MFFLIFAALDDTSERSFIEQLYNTHYRAMYRTALGILRHPEDAEDVVQSTCLALCKKTSLLAGMDCNALHSYVVISIRNTAINLMRSRDRRAELLWGEEDYLDSLVKPCETWEDDLFVSADEGVLTQAIMRMPLRERHLIEMKYILNEKTQEIAKELGIKPDSVRVLLMRTRRRLHDLMEEIAHEKED
jgi:RNA polymerase sigma-70 factor (ECF subfamily)